MISYQIDWLQVSYIWSLVIGSTIHGAVVSRTPGSQTLLDHRVELRQTFACTAQQSVDTGNKFECWGLDFREATLSYASSITALNCVRVVF